MTEKNRQDFPRDLLKDYERILLPSGERCL